MLIFDLKAMALFQPAHHRVIIGLLAHTVAVNRMGGALLYSLHDAGAQAKSMSATHMGITSSRPK